jgi:flagellar biosynthesis/type III secretory pathway M-ring protein FliF/YscJ
MPDLPLTLAQNATLDTRAFIYIVLLIILCIAGFVIIMSVKRRIFDESKEQDQSAATLMESLEHMRKSGEISQEEYEQTRRTVIEKTRAMLNEQDDQGPSKDSPKQGSN